MFVRVANREEPDQTAYFIFIYLFIYSFFFFGEGGGRKINIFGGMMKLWIILDILGSHLIHFGAFFLKVKVQNWKMFLRLQN